MKSIRIWWATHNLSTLISISSIWELWFSGMWYHVVCQTGTSISGQPVASSSVQKGLLYPESAVSTSLWNTGTSLPYYLTLHHRRPLSSYSVLSEPQILYFCIVSWSNLKTKNLLQKTSTPSRYYLTFLQFKYSYKVSHSVF